MINDVHVETKSRAPHHTVWLVVDYTGTEPPLALFDDLEMIGWKPPVPAAPPASAIDWSTPNPVTGARFSILAWRVEGAVVEPPKGSASRGHWTATERDLFLLSLEGVLRRHGLLDQPEPESAPLPEPPVATAAVPLPTPPTPAAHTEPVTPPAPAETATPAPLGTTESQTTVVRAEVKPAQRDQVTAALVPLGVTAHIGEATKTITNSYRGTAFETSVTVLELEALVANNLAEITAAVLRDLGLSPTVHHAPDGSGDPGERAEGAVPTTTGQPAADDDEVIDLEPDVIVELRVLVPQAARSRAEAIVEAHLVEPHAVLPAAITVRNTYRGSTFESIEPAVKLVCALPGRPAQQIAAQLGSTFGFSVDDRTRIAVEPRTVSGLAHQPAEGADNRSVRNVST